MTMELIDNINHLLGDSLKRSVQPGMKLKVAASCFSIYAFEALKAELEKVASFEFIFTSPTFVPDEVTIATQTGTVFFSIEKAKRILGYRPRILFPQGTALVEQWLRFANYL